MKHSYTYGSIKDSTITQPHVIQTYLQLVSYSRPAGSPHKRQLNGITAKCIIRALLGDLQQNRRPVAPNRDDVGIHSKVFSVSTAHICDTNQNIVTHVYVPSIMESNCMKSMCLPATREPVGKSSRKVFTRCQYTCSHSTQNHISHRPFKMHRPFACPGCGASDGRSRRTPCTHAPPRFHC
jgi:hypothetical protein